MHHSLRTPLRFLQHVPSPAAPASAVTPATAATIAGHSDEDEDNDDEMVGRILSRREVLTLLGAAGVATLLAACSTSSDDATSVPTATTAPSAASGTDTGTSTSTSGAGAITEPTATTAAQAATEPASEPTAAATEAATEVTATATEAEAESTIAETLAELPLPACVVSPQLTEGPYFVDAQLNRSDVRTDPDTGIAVEGATLDLALRVSSVGSDGCVALAGAMVDIWQCDAEGTYSAVNDSMEGFNTVGQQFLRGYQISDEHGIVRFETIYPGWYRGRAVHIHFKVRTEDADGQSFEFTSQFFFDDTLSDEVFTQAPYAAKGDRDQRNDTDGIYRSGGSELLLDVLATADGSGYEALFDIGIATA